MHWPDPVGGPVSTAPTAATNKVFAARKPEDFDQTGFELPAAPQVAPADSGQGELFGDEYAQPDAADREPVFWPDGAGQSTPDDAYVQADAADCAN